MGLRRSLLAAVVIFLIGGVGVGIAVVSLLWRGSSDPLQGPRRAFEWPSGVAANSANERQLLTGLGFPNDSPQWRLYRILIAPQAIETGPHFVPEHARGPELLDYLTRNGRRPSAVVVIPEGYDQFQIAQRLEAAQVCESSAFLKATRDRELLATLKIAGDSAEGYLFPDSYELYENSSPVAVVTRLVRRARVRLAESARLEGIDERIGDLNWERRIVTLASLIEKEAADASELRLIAGVFVNRLTDPGFHPAQMIQTDPAAAYGCKLYGQTLASCNGYAGRVTPAMLRDSGNPYNTYRHPGLPPGPIASPGEAALRAAMNPSKTEYYFFVARGDGRHTFSRTLVEHREAIHGGK